MTTSITAQEILRWITAFSARLSADEATQKQVGGWLMMKTMESQLIAEGRNGAGITILQADDFFAQYMPGGDDGVKTRMATPGTNTPLSKEAWEALIAPLQGDGINTVAVYLQLLPNLPEKEGFSNFTPADLVEFVYTRLTKSATQKDFQLLKAEDHSATLIDTPEYSLDILCSPVATLGWMELKSRVGDHRDFWRMADLGYRYGVIIERRRTTYRLGIVGKTGVAWALDDFGTPSSAPVPIGGMNGEEEGSDILTQILLRFQGIAREEWAKNTLAEIKEMGTVWCSERKIGVRLPVGKKLSLVAPVPAQSRYRDSVLDQLLTILTMTLSELGKAMLRDSFQNQCSLTLTDYAEDPLALIDSQTEALIRSAGMGGKTISTVMWDVYEEMLETAYAQALQPWKHTVLEAVGALQKGKEVYIEAGDWQEGQKGKIAPEIVSMLSAIDGQDPGRAVKSALLLLQTQVPNLDKLQPLKWWRIDRSKFNSTVRGRCRA